MIGLSFIYAVAGTTFLLFAGLGLFEKRWGSAAFYGLLALSFFAGNFLGDFGNGLLVIALIASGSLGRMRRSRIEVTDRPQPRGNELFVPALIIPATALAGTLLFRNWPGIIDPKQVTLVALTLGVLLALLVSFLWLKPLALDPFREGARLANDIGWAMVLPQMLASLGAVFALAGVGEVVGSLAGHAIPQGSLVGAVIAYCLGMALFTMVMGNAFAAFPVLAAAIGMPLLVHGFGGDPARIAAIGMLAGFCGTLMTPMAANYNLVPVALLKLRDRGAVIKAQVPTAIPLLAFNVLLLYLVI